MSENGQKVMKLWANKLDIEDFRMNSKLTNKKLLFDTSEYQME